MAAKTFEEVMKSSPHTKDTAMTRQRDGDSFSIFKTDDDKRLVFGWASISITVDGEQLEDRQKDIIDPEDLEEAAYEYVLNFRDTGEEHVSTMRKKGKLVESCVFTAEKQKAIGIPEGILPVGWWIGFKIEDDSAWEKVKNGTYRMFSIEGKANRIPVEKGQLKGCGVLVVQNGKILAGTRIERGGRGKLCGPGGHIEAGETPEEAAKREAWEEFGITCKELTPLGTLKDGTSAIFLCTKFSGTPETDEEEMTDPKWMTIEELQEENLFGPFEASLEHLAQVEKKSRRDYDEYPEFGMWLEENLDASIEEQKAAKKYYAENKEKAKREWKHAPRSVAKTFDEILKGNPYHDSLGRFASSPGGAAAVPKMNRADAIADYQNYAYQTVNEGLRAGKVEGNAKAITDAIDEAINDAEPTKWAQTLHRADGTATTAVIWEETGLTEKLPQRGDMQDVWSNPDARDAIKQAMVGQTFTDKGFMSTSKDWEKAEEFATGNRYNPHGVEAIVHINVPKGTKVLDLGDDGFIMGSGEAETILPRGSSYKITAVMMNHRIGGLDIYADLLTGTAKSAPIAKTFVEVLKFNPFHDAKGRFASSSGFASYSANPKTKAGAMAISRSAQAGHGTTFNVHRESQGENVGQNYKWLNGGPGAKQLAAQGQLASQQPKQPPKPQKNYDKRGFADYDDAAYHQLYNGKQYYAQQKLTTTEKNAAANYLSPYPERGSLYSHCQNMNYMMATGQTLTGQYKKTHDGMMSSMHNIGYNVELTRYDHAGFLNGMLKSLGAGNDYEKMSQASIKKALVGQTLNENKFLSASYNNFKNASNASVFTSRAVKINYKCKAGTQAMMPGVGPGGDFGEIVLAPTNGKANKGGKIVDVRLTGKMARRQGTQTYNQPQIEIDIEIG